MAYTSNAFYNAYSDGMSTVVERTTAKPQAGIFVVLGILSTAAGGASWVGWSQSDFMQWPGGWVPIGALYEPKHWVALVSATWLLPLGLSLLLIGTHRVAKQIPSSVSLLKLVLISLLLVLCAVFALVYAAQPWTKATNQFNTYFGWVAFCVASGAAAVALQTAWRHLNGSYGVFDSEVIAAPPARPRLWTVLFLVLYLPCLIFLTTVLPNMWRFFSWSTSGDVPRPPVPGDVKAIGKDDGNGVNKAVLSVHVFDWKDGTPFYMKLWPDVLIYYGFLYVVTIAGVASQCCDAIRKALHTRAVGRLSVGAVLLCLLVTNLVILWVWYWGTHHKYEGKESVYPHKVDVVARVFGQLASLFMSLLLLPLPRRSIWGGVFGISWEAGIAYHRWLGYGVFLTSAVHQFAWWRVWYLDNDKELDPAKQVGRFPGDLFNLPLHFHADNFTIPLMSFTWWVAVLLVLVLSVPWVRRNKFELFYYAHHFAMVLLLVALIHATSFWYFALGGLVLWFYDRLVRFSRGCRQAVLLEAAPRGEGPSAITELRVEVEGTFAFTPGQFAFLNIPAIGGLEWHPFTISSAPSDGVLTFHIKALARPNDIGIMDPSLCWTGRLHSFAGQQRTVETAIGVDGPYGTPPDTSRYSTVVFVVGGIGITPANSMLRQMKKEVVDTDDEGTSLITVSPRAHLVWFVRSFEPVESFASTLADIHPFSRNTGITASVLVTQEDIKMVQEDHLAALLHNLSEERAVEFLRKQVSELASQLPDPRSLLVFCCAPSALQEATAKIVRDVGCDSHFETFCL